MGFGLGLTLNNRAMSVATPGVQVKGGNTQRGGIYDWQVAPIGTHEHHAAVAEADAHALAIVADLPSDMPTTRPQFCAERAES